MMNMMPAMAGAAPQGAGAGGMSLPQILAMIQQSQGGGGGMAPPSGATPMSNYIGPQSGGGMMQHQAMPGVAAPAQIGGAMPGGTAGGPAGGNQLMQLLAQLKGGQTGVPPGQGGVPGNTPSSLRVNPDGSITGTPGVPLPQPQPGPAGAPDFSALRAAGAFQPPPGGAMPPGGQPGGMPAAGGQMNPALMQWLHGMLNGGQQPPQGGGMPGGNG